MRQLLGKRAGQLQEVALDLALLATFAVAWLATRSIHEIAQWFPNVVTVAGIGIVSLKLLLDLYTLANPAGGKPTGSPDPAEPHS